MVALERYVATEEGYIDIAISDDSDVTLSVTGTPAGALHTPGLPLLSATLSTTFTWTPTYADLGTHVLTYSITDGLLSTNCSVTIKVKTKVKPRRL